MKRSKWDTLKDEARPKVRKYLRNMTPETNIRRQLAMAYLAGYFAGAVRKRNAVGKT